MDNEKFGKFIKELRKQNNLTQKELAAKLNLTDKAISKWERGLSFPDITMLNDIAEVFHVDVSEILNGEFGKKDNIDIEKIVNETINNIKKKQEKKEQVIKKTKKIVKIISLVIFILFICLQCGYIFVLKSHDFEYIIDQLFYIVNEVIIFNGTISILLWVKKNKIKDISSCVVFVIATIINLCFMINNTLNTTSIIDFSNNFSHELIIKLDKETGSAVVYKDIRLFIFARPKLQLPYEIKGDIKRQWLTNDICNVTYTDKDANLREYVATYGDRGNGVSYSYVFNVLQGDWLTLEKEGNHTRLNTNRRSIIIYKNGKTETFDYSDIKQYGTIAIVLYQNELPRYVVALNKDCSIDDKTHIIKDGGTITVVEVSMKKTIPEKLSRTIANISVEKNNYKIKDGILYYSYDGETIIDVPGDFSSVEYNDYNYQISDFKTVFFNEDEQQKYLIYSDDMGNTWQKTNINVYSYIQNIQFINKDVGFMLQFYDKVMGTTFGETEDGGKTWKSVSKGIGNYGKEEFKTGSHIYFINENIGFLTMPNISGEYCKLYITKNGGHDFEELNISNNQIYDFYNLPTIENGVLTLEISQGSDGDYNGGDSLMFISNDNANSWIKK